MDLVHRHIHGKSGLFQSFLGYIPYGSIFSLPDDTIHASGFMLGCITGKEYTNRHIYFYICNCSGLDDEMMQDAEWYGL